MTHEIKISLTEEEYEDVDPELCDYYVSTDDGYELNCVGGLKSALGKERETAKTAKTEIKTIRETLDKLLANTNTANLDELVKRVSEFGVIEERHKTEIKTMTDAHASALTSKEADHTTALAAKDSELAKMSDAALTGKIESSISKHAGNAQVLLPHVKSKLAATPRADVDEIVSAMRLDSVFAGNFQSTKHSGTGSDPQHPGDGPSPSARHTAAQSKPRSQMSDREKVDFQKAHGIDKFMDLPA